MKYQFQREHVLSFATRFGYETKEKGDELVFKRCPRCGSTGKGDSYTFSVSLKSGAFCCLRASCGYKGHFAELARDYDYDLGITAEPYKALPQPSKYVCTDTATEYLRSRGIRPEIVQRYGITTSARDKNKLLFPFYSVRVNADGERVTRMEYIKYRLISYDKSKGGAKEWAEEGCKPILFGMDHCDPAVSRTLIMTEGQIDSLSVASAGLPNAVSVPNGARGFTWVPHCRDFVEQFDTVVVFGDCERGEITLAKTIREAFPKLTIRTPRMKDYLGEKDANDILRAYGEAAVRLCVEKAEQWLPSTIRDMADVRAICLDDIPHFSTGLPLLDRVLGGGLYAGQLITLTGKRGTGKSTLASMFGVTAIAQRQKVLFYSGEMADFEVKRWIDLQVAGDDFVQEQKRTGYTSYYIRTDTEATISEWYRRKLYIIDNTALAEEKSRTIFSEAEAAVRAYGVNFVIVDNLMTAIDSGDDLYGAQSRFVKQLKILAQKLQVTVLLLAHPRKATGKELSSDDVGGSGDITNLSDTVITLDRKESADGEHRVFLSVQKNRATGMLLTGGNRLELAHSTKSKRLWQRGSVGDKVYVPALRTATRTIEPSAVQYDAPPF